MKKEKDYCEECSRSTAKGSGLFVDRILGTESYICRECDEKMQPPPELTERTWVCTDGELYHWNPLIPIRCSEELMQNLEDGMSPKDIFDPDYGWKEGVDYVIPAKWKIIEAIMAQFDDE